MGTPESLKYRLKALLKETPNSLVLPPEPWWDGEMEEIAKIVSEFITTENSVIDDHDPWAEWLDRYYFHRSRSIQCAT
jgi:hypothetical protein